LERLEAALETLKQQGVICHWQYADSKAVDQLPRRGWMGLWLNWQVEIEPPDEIREHYAGLSSSMQVGQTISSTEVLSIPDVPLPGRMKAHRTALGLAQAQVAEILGIHQVHYSRLELGRRHPTAALLARIEKWLSE
jgi:DNA-binding XRE family transcriptional regulator